MEGDALKTGKALVKATLIDPLIVRGMKRKAGQNVAAFEAMQESLQARLAYMSRGNLIVLAEMVERLAGGKLQDTWPSEITICNLARKLQEPVASESRMVRSYLQSGAGKAALAGGYLVELFNYLKRYGMPPTNDYAFAMLREKGQESARRRALVAERIERGFVEPADQVWLRDYAEQLARCEDIVNSNQEAAA